MRKDIRRIVARPVALSVKSLTRPGSSLSSMYVSTIDLHKVLRKEAHSDPLLHVLPLLTSDIFAGSHYGSSRDIRPSQLEGLITFIAAVWAKSSPWEPSSAVWPTVSSIFFISASCSSGACRRSSEKQKPGLTVLGITGTAVGRCTANARVKRTFSTNQISVVSRMERMRVETNVRFVRGYLRFMASAVQYLASLRVSKMPGEEVTASSNLADECIPLETMTRRDRVPRCSAALIKFGRSKKRKQCNRQVVDLQAKVRLCHCSKQWWENILLLPAILGCAIFQHRNSGVGYEYIDRFSL